jgi:hypothetical protein
MACSIMSAADERASVVSSIAQHRRVKPRDLGMGHCLHLALRAPVPIVVT